MLNNSRILLTGGTGSFGSHFISMTLDRYPSCEIVVISRDEMKQWEMKIKLDHNPRVRFIIGDVRDEAKLRAVTRGIDFIVHAAATKIVPTAEENPSECIKTNILGAMNIIDASLAASVKGVVALSTDKACNPVNLYGATKLASDKLFISANNQITSEAKTKFSVVRYGNVMGSRGSVIPFFLSLDRNEPIPITDHRMTRFMITLDEGVHLVWRAFSEMVGGEIFVKKIPSMKIDDIARAVVPNRELKLVGIRPGEKLHEQMISVEDALNTLEFDSYYKIMPSVASFEAGLSQKGARRVEVGFAYSSDTNKDWMTVEDLRRWASNRYGIAINE